MDYLEVVERSHRPLAPDLNHIAATDSAGRTRQAPLEITRGDSALVVSYGDNTTGVTGVHVVEYSDAATYIKDVSDLVGSLVSSLGGAVPDTVIHELVSNLIHASFAAPVISIMDGGNTVRVADSGPGIKDPSLALEPGYTSSAAESRGVIRGVGWGLAAAVAELGPLGGRLTITNNAGAGVVVTASVPARAVPSVTPVGLDAVGEASTENLPSHAPATRAESAAAKGVALSTRQREVLAVVASSLEAGPSNVADSLAISLSTAHRDLLFLEKRGLVAVLGGGKRQVTALGLEVLRIY